ncbi:hypothetical protein B0H67DRAFT_74056 [Lasiosphaeris hirsuta]|uniref:Uncharacterized protein n=1 Tax=Lasiosphaeris hirsuta TaxID=260670 RepID=A0AA40E7T9_9PEZI|nr:hypothetical protein B0H67DRAFT_74056 [Lasiosphaeris hirsuta]
MELLVWRSFPSCPIASSHPDCPTRVSHAKAIRAPLSTPEQPSIGVRKTSGDQCRIKLNKRSFSTSNWPVHQNKGSNRRAETSLTKASGSHLLQANQTSSRGQTTKLTKNQEWQATQMSIPGRNGRRDPEQTPESVGRYTGSVISPFRHCRSQQLGQVKKACYHSAFTISSHPQSLWTVRLLTRVGSRRCNHCSAACTEISGSALVGDEEGGSGPRNT